MKIYSDGRERPDSHDGNALTRSIEEYFAKPHDAQLARLKAENAELRAQLDRRKPAPPLKARAAAR